VPAAPALLLAPLSLHDALPISIVGNRKLLFLAPGIELVLASGGANFSWNHCEPHEMIWYLPYEIGLVMLTSLRPSGNVASIWIRSEEHTSELQSRFDVVCRLLR